METEKPGLFQIDNVLHYTAGGFARMHGIPVQTVYSAADSGRITAHRFGGRLFLLASSADTYAKIYKATKGTS